jgi:hypothetical protein
MDVGGLAASYAKMEGSRVTMEPSILFVYKPKTLFCNLLASGFPPTMFQRSQTSFIGTSFCYFAKW